MQRWHPLPAWVYRLVERTPASVLLESAASGRSAAPSRLFLFPQRVLTATDAPSLDGLFHDLESATHLGHFAAGYFSYECGVCFEPTTAAHRPPPGQPLAWFGLYSRCHIFDHGTGTFLDGGPAETMEAGLIEPGVGDEVVDILPSLSASEYGQRIEAIHEFIRAGDAYQLNFTFPIRFKAEGGAAGLYAALRGRQPVDYGAFLHCNPGRWILSLSPELFFSLSRDEGRRQMVTRPMKGTAPRGRTTIEDRAVAEWLRKDAKNRSENVMIVDLVRNDLGRICEFGSVRVDELFGVEKHPSLWQMTSTICGDLRSDLSFRDIFRALFPSGSVTGAPKVRAMQLLGQIEHEPRGVYTGAIGFFSQQQTIFNVAIRTIELSGSEGRMGVGSGIVIDSIAVDEFRECALKAHFLTGLSKPFALLETLLWDSGYPLMELHLDRLEDSSRYFEYPCHRTAVKAALLQLAKSFGAASPRRVRLTLNADGEFQITHEPLMGLSEASDPFRACIAALRTDPADRFLFHKTTNRSTYDEAFNAAQRAGFADALFLNREEQVTEGAISNIFIERNGKWFTPPLECGVLAGVYRRHLLAARPEVEERILSLEDLKAADCVYLSNAVRGLRRVVIDWEHGAVEAAIYP